MARREYQAYLLRLWREKQDGSWRGLLENPNNDERFGFATLADLVALLEDKTGEIVQPSGYSHTRAEAQSPPE